MRRITQLLAWMLLVLTVHLAPGKVADRTPVFVIDRPMVIAFYPDTAKATGKYGDGDDSYSEFKLYSASARQPLAIGGVDMQEVYATEFRVVIDGRTTTFRPRKKENGYYFAAPGRKPRIEYGVMSDQDIVRIAHEYFGNAMK